MTSVWLPLALLIYAAIILLWARVSSSQNTGSDGFFSAGHALAPWVTSVAMAGASLSGWLLLGGTQTIAQHGLQMPVLLVSAILIALPGVIFFKRIWLAAMRLRVSSQAGLFHAYYQSPFLVIMSTLVALVFAIGLTGVQLRVSAEVISGLTDHTVAPLTISVFLGFLLFAGIGIGGLRSCAYLGVLQTVFVGSAMTVLAGFALLYSGGFTGLNAKLFDLAQSDGGNSAFLVQKVILFSSGLGRSTDPATAQTAAANLGFALALMGFQCGPVAIKLILSTRTPNAVAAGQTWVLAGAFGLLIAFGLAALGLAGLVDETLTLGNLLEQLDQASPWFAAWSVIGVIAGIQAMAGLSVFVASESLVRQVYRSYFRSSLSKGETITLTRIAVALIILIGVLMQNLTPITVSAIAALALPLSVQLATPMLGIAWARWITRPAAICGVGFGAAAVVLTEPMGLEILSYLGLELPWGRWPWTLHSAAWGLGANMIAVVIISAITNRQDITEEARHVHRLFEDTLAPPASVHALRPTAWSLVLGWIFLAVGPGLIFGNHAFAQTTRRGVVTDWVFDIPSLWAWSLGAWLLGVGLIWFLAYKMALASPLRIDVAAYQPPRQLKIDTSQQERANLRVLVMALGVAFAVIVLIRFGFGL